jgi:hypothetical protein
LRSGVELKKFAKHLSINQGPEFDEKFEACDNGNIEVLERLRAGLAEDYKFAEEPTELSRR